MKIILFTILGLTVFSAQSQIKDSSLTECSKAFISMPQYRVLYLDYDNRFEYSNCSDCDTVILKLRGATYTERKKNSGIIRAEEGTKRATVRLLCVKGQDTLTWGAYGFSVQSLPDPKIYLGNVWLSDPLIDEAEDLDIIFKPAFRSIYSRDEMVSGIRMQITEWSVSLGKRTYFGESKYLTEELRDLIFNSEKGEAIFFNYVDVKFENGKTRRIHINRVYHKKTEYGTKPEVTKQSTIAPADG